MKLSSLAGILWVASFISNAFLFAILCFRRRVKRFPIFTGLIGLGLVRSIALFWLWRHSQWSLYWTVYYDLMVVDTCLQFALIWEIASKVFRRRGVWVRDVRGRLFAGLIACVAIACALTALQKVAGQSWLQDAILRAAFFPSILICELFVVMLVLSSEAGLNWRTHVASIAVGFAAFNFPAVIIDTAANFQGFDRQGYLSSLLENARKELYLACLIFWCYSMWRPEPKPRIMSPNMEGQVSGLKDVLVRRHKNWSEQ
jgi:hypothetical protein